MSKKVLHNFQPKQKGHNPQNTTFHQTFKLVVTPRYIATQANMQLTKHYAIT